MTDVRSVMYPKTWSPQPVTVEHLNVFCETFADLADAEVMKGAWE
jgi:hypothetical protein